jgi:CheY-like chemotaxis protein
MNVENLRMLIVDDEVDLCQVLSWDFEDAGMIVEQTNGGHKAIEILKNSQFDIVLSDVKMPEGDGIELLEYIYENKIDIKAVYLMTGYSDYPIEKLIAKGMRRLFNKPVETEVMIDDIRSIEEKK